MVKGSWLAALGVCTLVGSLAQADDKGSVYITPTVGYNHLRIDRGRVFDQPETIHFDSLEYGPAIGYRAPFGLIVEVGHTDAIHANIFNNQDDFYLAQTFGSVGWEMEFADGWHIQPRVGRGRWALSSDHRVLLDAAGERHHEIKGWDNFWGVSLIREVSKTFSLGVNFKDVDQEFGHSRAAEFMVRFQF